MITADFIVDYPYNYAACGVVIARVVTRSSTQ
jgi:hypothetical protein